MKLRILCIEVVFSGRQVAAIGAAVADSKTGFVSSQFHGLCGSDQYRSQRGLLAAFRKFLILEIANANVFAATNAMDVAALVSLIGLDEMPRLLDVGSVMFARGILPSEERVAASKLRDLDSSNPLHVAIASAACVVPPAIEFVPAIAVAESPMKKSVAKNVTVSKKKRDAVAAGIRKRKSYSEIAIDADLDEKTTRKVAKEIKQSMKANAAKIPS